MADGLHTSGRTGLGDDAEGSGGEDGSPDQPPGRSSTRPPGAVVVVVHLDDADLLTTDQASWLAGAAQRAVVQAVTRSQTPDVGGEVRVRVVGDDEMSTLHARHAGETGTTDVLTFDLRDDLEEPLDADIVVCVDEAKRQATERGLLPERELLLYILHGALHCLGHDDHDDEAYRAMHAEEDAVLTAIGVGRTFDADATQGARS